jgi:hypothetical protein
MLAPLAAAIPGNDLESRLHQSVPRLFVKSVGLKRRVRLMKAANNIGRAETADVLLPHESVSELHAEITFDGAVWRLRDCGGTNGTIVDGKHLRSEQQDIGRNTLIVMGSLQLVFLCTDARAAALDRRIEERALSWLVKTGRLTGTEARQMRELTRNDANQSIPEILLMETALGPVDWATAIATARRQKSLWDRIRGLFSLFGKKRQPNAPQ